ncbi:hypothetical protein KC340_g1211 [Hortaea werneckii]|nr:hypothetical protein KC342_g2163 [Hortaea werneckii]KAI7106880.1 hypothetical protein KC339_g2781 [Hortaea werneckii]KAI7215048.1 hypothetical protein KC365_g13711 [Hortaea werneckii]KAI7337686.1 hypothetical protein KC340_g1211 [Hortaea werneckii]KAI7381718.1 hypothetical protein KC328_g12082 [Hortaea werneckii]
MVASGSIASAGTSSCPSLAPASPVTSPVSIEECTNLTTFGTTTITAFQPGLNSTITVFQSGDNASCAYSTANSSGLITGYEQQRTVTQTGPTVTIFYNISPSPSRAESTTLLSPDTAASNSPSTSLAESTASSVSPPTQTPIAANATDLQQQSTSSDPFVTAQVVKSDDNPPIAPNTSDTFLLVTFGNNGTSATSAGSFRKRQSSDQSLVYNATQSFAAIAGGIYNLSAAAASAPYGSSPPNCAITICGDSTCGPRSQLSTSFAEYSFTWTSSATQNSVATFSIQCAGQAYVALTNVTVTPIYIPQPTYSSSSASAASSGAEMSSSFRFEPTREVTTTAYGTRTEYITATTSAWYTFTTEGAPRTITTTYGQTSTLTFTEPASTYITSELIYSTLISSYVVTTTQDQTRYRNLTYTQPATTIYPSPSIIIQTDVMTSFLPGYNQTLTTTYISTELSIAYSTGIMTLYITSTSIPPPITLNASTVFQTQEASTVVLTSLVPTTYYVTSTFETSIIQTTTLAQPTLTLTFLTTEISTYVFSLTSTLPQATTVLHSTLTTTSMLPGNTSYLISTEIQTLTSVLPPTTVVLYSTILSELPASSITQTEVSSLFLTDTTYITQTLDPQTFTSISLSIQPASTAYITSTLPASTAYLTYTTISDKIITESTFLPASTITETSLKPPSTFYLTQTSILPASTVLVTSTLPRETFTPERVTETSSLSLPRGTETATSIIRTTLPASTLISTYSLTETTSLPPGTETATSIVRTTLPASTYVSTFRLTETATSIIQTTLPASTEYSTGTETFTLPASTVVSTFLLTATTSLPPGTETATSIIRTTLPASTEYSTGTATLTLPASTIIHYRKHVQANRDYVVASPYRNDFFTTWDRNDFVAGSNRNSYFDYTDHTASVNFDKHLEVHRNHFATSSTVSPITETTIQYITSTLPRQTDMITYTSVQPAETSYITATSTLPQQTTTMVSTLSASTVVSTDYSTIPPRTFTERVTSTLPPETRTIVSTLPQATTTEYSTLPASTVVSTATSTLPAQTSTQVVTSTLPPGTTTLVSTYASTAVVTYTSVRDASTSYLTATTTRERTQTVTAYTTLEASTYTSTVYSTVQTTEVQTQVSTMPASSIYVTYTTTVQGQVQTVTFTYTPTTSTPGALLLCLAHGIHRHHSNCVRDIHLPFFFFFGKQSGYKYKQLKNKQPCFCDYDHDHNNDKNHIILKFSKRSTTSATANVDDNLFAVTVPFAVSLYGVASTTITVTSNGILAVASPVTTAYNNAALPQYSVCGTGLLAFWDDLIINAGRTQGIFWSSEGRSPSRSITFEFYESKYQAPDTYAHFLVSFWEDRPGIATIDFLNITDNGISATVGGQGQAANLFAQYSFNQAIINNGLLITLNSTTNSWYTGYPPGIFAMPGAIYY